MLLTLNEGHAGKRNINKNLDQKIDSTKEKLK